eukprot:scaffold170272_cov33-Tisochrysis_lutea.AAC.6
MARGSRRREVAARSGARAWEYSESARESTRGTECEREREREGGGTEGEPEGGARCTRIDPRVRERLGV